MKTRAAATPDGGSIDMATLAAQMGLQWPVFMSDESWEDCVAWDEGAEACAGQSESGRLRDVLGWALLAEQNQTAVARRRIEFHVQRVPKGGEEPVAKLLVWNLLGEMSKPYVLIRTADEFET